MFYGYHWNDNACWISCIRWLYSQPIHHQKDIVVLYCTQLKKIFMDIPDIESGIKFQVRGYHEMPQKACEREFSTWEHFHNFLKCPKIEEFHFRFLFGLKIDHVLIFWNAPLFMFEFFEMPHFSHFQNKIGKMGHFKKFEH